MEEIRATKSQIRTDIAKTFDELSESQVSAKTKAIENRLFEFANFLESRTILLYAQSGPEVQTVDIINKTIEYNKVVVLPAFNPETFEVTLLKIDNPEKELKPGPRGALEPAPGQCKIVPIDRIDIAIIPGVAFDEKGGRIGTGRGYYDRLIPKLSITTRKVALTFEDQILQQVPLESHDKHVDIIITDNRIIYKI